MQKEKDKIKEEGEEVMNKMDEMEKNIKQYIKKGIEKTERKQEELAKEIEE